MRLAAAADLHAGRTEPELLHELVTGACREADALVLAGDLTDLGLPEQAEVLLEVLEPCTIPVVATLGNHDCEGGFERKLASLLAQSGVYLLDGSGVVLEGVGFAGVRGFGGGFGKNVVAPFGERALKDFVQESIRQAEVLRRELRALPARRRVAVLHYAPVTATLEGEPPELYPLLGTSRLEWALDESRATVAFHGHAHSGSPEGKTRGGVPVYNVSLPVLRRAGSPKPYVTFEVR